MTRIRLTSRTVNGAFFASLYATLHFFRIWTSGHNIFRCFWLNIEFVYNAFNLIFTFLGPANCKPTNHSIYSDAYFACTVYLAFFFLANSAVANPAHDRMHFSCLHRWES